MEWKKLLESVSDEKIQFITARPERSEFAILDRQVVVTGPPELVRLRRTGNLQVLTELINLLKKPSRAWAAEVLLAAMTRREEDIVNAFAKDRHGWWNSVGKTAYERWSQWLNEINGKLIWDSTNEVFTIAE